jgi:hypothetical protein
MQREAFVSEHTDHHKGHKGGTMDAKKKFDTTLRPL